MIIDNNSAECIKSYHQYSSFIFINSNINLKTIQLNMLVNSQKIIILDNANLISDLMENSTEQIRIIESLHATDTFENYLIGQNDGTYALYVDEEFAY